MREIHPAVDADLLAEKEREQQIQELDRQIREVEATHAKERARRRFKSSLKQLLRRTVVALIIVALLGAAFGLELMAPALVGFLIQVALYWLAIQIGAWMQYTGRWCFYE